jgi:hypothetical protein
MAPFTAVIHVSHHLQTHLASSEATRCQGLDWPRARAGLKVGVRLPLSRCVFQEKTATDWPPLFLASGGSGWAVWGLATERVGMAAHSVTLRRLQAQKGSFEHREDGTIVAPCAKLVTSPAFCGGRQAQGRGIPSPTANPIFCLPLLMGEKSSKISGEAGKVARAPRTKNAYSNLEGFVSRRRETKMPRPR